MIYSVTGPVTHLVLLDTLAGPHQDFFVGLAG